MKKIKNLDLWIILAAITLAAIITSIVLVARPGQIKTLDKIKEVTIADYKTKGASTYFVFVYNEDKQGIEALNDEVIKYAEYSRTHKKVPKLYILKVKSNPTIFDDFKTENISISDSNTSSLITVTNGKYTVTTDGSKICNLLIEYETGKK